MPRVRYALAAGLFLLAGAASPPLTLPSPPAGGEGWVRGPAEPPVVVSGAERPRTPGAAAPVVVSCSPAGPPPVAWWAVFGRTAAYRGYYVGGGTPCRGDARACDEGTWGWDYQGRCCLPKVWLSWTHGRKRQGGEGAYKTEGPPVPNVFAVPPPRRGESDH